MNNTRRAYKAITHRFQAAIARIKNLDFNAHHPHASTDVQEIPSMDVQNIASYIYTPLPTADSFRLIELLPGMSGSPLRCNIILTRRSDMAGEYEALSYAWGEANFSQQLEDLATMSVIRITDNLYHALQRLRLKDQIRLLWVDAVCIAQCNVQEKNHQVRQMSLIYREARRVVVWLGNDDSEVFEQLACIGRSPRISDTVYEDSDTIRYIAYISDAHFIVYRFCRLQDLEDFFARSWFNRVWVVQEYVLAKDLHIYLGQSSMSGEAFRQAITLRKSPSEKGLRVDYDKYRILHRTVRLVAFRDGHRAAQAYAKIGDFTTRNYLNIARCLILLERRQCTDSRDRFYAILGLPLSTIGITPDYALDLGQVRMDVTRKALLAGDLSILDYADSFTTRALSGPSFLVRIPVAEGQRRVVRWPTTLHTVRSASLLKHAVNCHVPQVCDIGQSMIGINGVSIDRVTTMIFFRQKAGVNAESEISCDEDILNDFEFSPEQGFNTGLKILEIYKHISSLRSSRFNLSPSEHNACKRGFWRIVNANKLELTDNTALDSFESLLLDHNPRHSVIFERTFFLTELGFFGICSRWTRKGDHIVFLGGVPKPYMLRPATGEKGQRMWRLVGDCIVEDCMEGHYFEPETYDTCGKEIHKDAKRIPDDRFPGRTNKLREEQFILC
ncbi:heterokaryon incompatibility protein-domain-containing protein [Phaeosphaeria sp. MPI-PUGE-AT-0046c]|nr:heterokaryon incompatibility protein-domain-containing protein [Phaeosphaeria sp. MPI-PUGE-AT-0046c]